MARVVEYLDGIAPPHFGHMNLDDSDYPSAAVSSSSFTTTTASSSSSSFASSSSATVPQLDSVTLPPSAMINRGLVRACRVLVAEDSPTVLKLELHLLQTSESSGLRGV